MSNPHTEVYMKFKTFLITLCLSTQIIFSQEKIKISVFPFQNKSDKSYGWLSYGLSYMLTENVNSTGVFDAVTQEQIYKATSDPDINLISAPDGDPNPVLAKYQSIWNTHIFVVGNFTVTTDTLSLYARVCDLSKNNCSSPVIIKGGFQDYKTFYFLMTRFMESIYTEFKNYGHPLTPVTWAASQDKTRQLCADYDGYKAYIKSWMALRYYDDGLSAVNGGTWDDAIRYFELAQLYDETNTLSISANLSKVFVLRGNKVYQQSKWEEASKDYSSAIALDPKNSEAFYNLGNVFKNTQDYANALLNYNQSLVINPSGFDVYMNIGYVNIEQSRFSDAAAAYEKALSINENSATAHYYAGVAYDNSGDAANAVKHYRRAIELDPSLSGAHLNLGILLKQQKDLAGARKEYEQAVSLDPNNATAHRNLGILLMNDKKEYAAAADHLQKCLDLDPAQPDAAIIKKNIGVLKKKSGKKKK